MFNINQLAGAALKNALENVRKLIAFQNEMDYEILEAVRDYSADCEPDILVLLGETDVVITFDTTDHDKMKRLFKDANINPMFLDGSILSVSLYCTDYDICIVRFNAYKNTYKEEVLLQKYIENMREEVHEIVDNTSNSFNSEESIRNYANRNNLVFDEYGVLI